ncbi:hypothetical protein ANME2D_00685 [Candidatus Methanoperedens nitroreducens]|uniref:Gustatory receptor n=1 Tax=Candidatus Methanoperedens nitratireducens TaxID=1392998 RepID=A0A062VD71_9EURY|nr:hypothetical protein [Candidatus Methanoperedens nitroreducens]KCZ73614.1 hypothetical protein ANME2D_00685 [Candidatus Methanoperedens nitroreducens]MDJ1422425.1 hypothetical protein [Candidatus Methanoperedens sp.]
MGHNTENESAKPTFEAIILFKRIPYWIYWPAIGFLSFVLGELLTRFFAENYFLWSRLLFNVAFGTLPIINIWFFHSFRKTMQEISIFFWQDDAEFQRWLKNKEIHIFTLRSWMAKCVTGFIFVAGLITIILLGLPFKSELFNLIGLICFSIFLMFCGNTLYISIGLLSTLREIVNRPTIIPFFMPHHRVISKLQNYYLIQTLFIVLYYIGLVIAVWRGPYGLNSAMLIWLTGLASYPLVMFSWSFLQIHFLMQNIKQSYLETINSEVQYAFKNVFNGHDFQELEHLEKIMNIQNKIHTLAEWPVSVGGALTFLTSLATAIIQIIVSTYFRK